ncbi:MAG: hypothetical protein AB7K24_04515 [Gemmataceae bacterium]
MFEFSPKMKTMMLAIAALLCSLAGAGVHSLCTTSCPCKCQECPCSREAPTDQPADAQ